jgi:hypothetical protein
MSRVNEDREQAAADGDPGRDKRGERQSHDFEKEQIRDDGQLAS